MTSVVAQIGQRATHKVADFGDFCRFSGRVLATVASGAWRWRTLRLMLPQFYIVGTQSLVVVMITGAFVGAVLAVQSVTQLQSINRDDVVGTVVVLSVLRELGPVLAGVILSGRVGGGLAAELGTMRVTEQIDALRAMGTDPLRVLVVPRFLACVLLIPALVIYADALGIVGGYGISVWVYGVKADQFFRLASQQVAYVDIFYGPAKSVFFGAVISLISCYKGFRSEAGAAGVGRACTESFVACCMSILILNLFLGMFFNSLRDFFFGVKSIF